MKKRVVSMFILILLIGIVSAGLIEYYGRITGTVEVSGPVFYAIGEKYEGTEKWIFSLNEYYGDSISTSFTTSNKWLVTESLGVTSFYAADYNIYLDIKANQEDTIKVELWIVEEDFDKKGESICSSEKTINERDVYEILCPSISLVGINPSDRIALILYDADSSGTKYDVYIQGNTKIEVSPAT